jgi:hypothetical protein
MCLSTQQAPRSMPSDSAGSTAGSSCWRSPDPSKGLPRKGSAER